MTAEQRSCAWPGCSKPPSSSLGYPPHLACGHLHHLLLMARRFKPDLPHPPHQQVLDRNDKGLCVLRSCSKAPCPGHSWCSRSHYLTWLHEVYSSLSCEQICKLPECTCHVYVDENNELWEFCGWRHWQQAVMQKALQDLKNRAPHSPLPSVESEHKNHPSIKCLLQSLKHFARSLVAPKGIKVDGDFFGKHPWEVLSGDGQACFLIVPCKFTSGGKCRKRDMITMDKFHWKQQGPAKKKHGYLKKYYTYKKLKGRKKEKDEEQETVVFTMREYTLADVTTHSLIKLCKGQQPSQGRRCKVDFHVLGVLPRSDKFCGGACSKKRTCVGISPQLDGGMELVFFFLFWGGGHVMNALLLKFYSLVRTSSIIGGLSKAESKQESASHKGSCCCSRCNVGKVRCDFVKLVSSCHTGFSIPNLLVLCHPPRGNPSM